MQIISLQYKPEIIMKFNNMAFKSFAIIILVIFVAGKSNGQRIAKISVENKNNINIPDACIRINDKKILNAIELLSPDKFLIKADTVIPHQIIYKEGKISELLTSLDLEPNGKKSILIEKTLNPPEFKAKTQAEISVKQGGKWDNNKYVGGTFKNIENLRVPDEHTDHSFYIRYEGPGWESDRVGYRFYLDWRNAIDIFGKRVDTLVLQSVGLDGFDSYHQMADWGVDILKVGSSLGIGSIGYWDGTMANRVAKTDSVFCKIEYSGIIESSIITSYYGWKINDKNIDLTSTLTIQAGSRLTLHELTLSDKLPNVCTGIVKHDNAKIVLPEDTQDNNKWTYFSTYGKQTLEDDLLGMVIFYEKKDLIKIAEDKNSHVVVLATDNNDARYYFGAAWEHEYHGLKNEMEFKQYLDNQLKILNSEIEIRQK